MKHPRSQRTLIEHSATFSTTDYLPRLPLVLQKVGSLSDPYRAACAQYTMKNFVRQLAMDIMSRCRVHHITLFVVDGNNKKH